MIYYLCDGKACEGKEGWSECGLCHHTSQWEHAVHKDADPSDFTVVSPMEGRFDLWEPDSDE